jgi:hypothetical protein
VDNIVENLFHRFKIVLLMIASLFMIITPPLPKIMRKRKELKEILEE